MMEVFEKHPIVTEEKPRVLTVKNVVFWSEHYKRLEGMEGIKEKTAKAIQSKAKIFLKHGLIQYDPDETKYPSGQYDGHRFVCKPLIGYNKTTYRMWWNKERQDFECSRQFNQTTKIPCSHITGLWLWIKIKNWNK